MKLEIDTVNKTIILKSHATLSELKKELKNLVDGDSYRLISDVVYTGRPYYYPQPPMITLCDSVGTFTTCGTTADTILISTN